jgi:hypothetical protein
MSDADGRGYVGASADAVVAAELRSLKPDARVYEQLTPGLFFRSTRKDALANAEKRLEAERAEQRKQPRDGVSRKA